LEQELLDQVLKPSTFTINERKEQMHPAIMLAFDSELQKIAADLTEAARDEIKTALSDEEKRKRAHLYGVIGTLAGGLGAVAASGKIGEKVAPHFGRYARRAAIPTGAAIGLGLPALGYGAGRAVHRAVHGPLPKTNGKTKESNGYKEHMARGAKLEGAIGAAKGTVGGAFGGMAVGRLGKHLMQHGNSQMRAIGAAMHAAGGLKNTAKVTAAGAAIGGARGAIKGTIQGAKQRYISGSK
jgi:hypothetical protein